MEKNISCWKSEISCAARLRDAGVLEPTYYGHSIRTARYLVWLYLAAVECGLIKPMYSQETVFFAGLLHDIGKQIVPRNIIQKNGSLTQGEYRVMKRHAEFSTALLMGQYNTIRRICGQSFEVDPTVSIAVSHHERMDGKGYPFKLQGEDISPLAKMCAVADVYDALTSDRPYHKGATQEEAARILEQCEGTQLDTQYVVLFLQKVASMPQ
jgi:HD-GYP domain-containing protein (c-di-GMP phosphodiesterase class II)